MKYLRSTAIHEAGHVVAHIRRNLDHGDANIIPDGNGLLGGASGEGVEHVWDENGAEPVVIAYCAGYAAMIAAGYSDVDSRSGADDDFDNAEQLIEFWGLPDGIAIWQGRAVEMMREPENIAAVALVADYLVRHGKLAGDVCDEIVKAADGKTTQPELERFLRLCKLI